MTAHFPPYYTGDARFDRMPKHALRAVQAERLKSLVAYIYEATPFWRRKLDEAGVDPRSVTSVDDLTRLPFCDKKELLADQAAHPPFGSYVGTPQNQWYRIFSTSGTTGTPLKRVVSRADWKRVLDRFLRISPVGPGDIVAILGPLDDLFGATAGAEGLAHAGALVLPLSRYDTRKKIELMVQYRPVAVSGTASYLMHMAEVAREMGVDLTSLGIKGLNSVGEPGAAIPATRERLAKGWGAFVGDGYGLTEILPLGNSCLHHSGTHIPDDLVITEIVDPATGLQCQPGEPGEIVFTNLICDTHPLLRYRTGDIARIEPGECCKCGFTGTVLARSIEGRVDDMIWFKGINLYPAVIEQAVRSVPQAGDEFEIVIEGAGNPVMRVRVETDRAEEATKTAITLAIRKAAGLGVQVELIEPGTLSRADGRTKARRVRDLRGRD